jgi:hypothetical protein
MHKMTKKPPVEIKEIGDEVFVLVDGVKIAMRGAPDSVQAGTWVAIEELCGNLGDDV